MLLRRFYGAAGNYGITLTYVAPRYYASPCTGSEILYELSHGLETIEVAQSTDAKQKLLYSVSASVKRYSVLRCEVVTRGWLTMRNVTYLSSSGLGVRN